MTRHVLLQQGEDGYIVAEVPSLPGCISQGKTEADAIANIREAMALWLEVATEHGDEIDDDMRAWIVTVEG